jgi:hypothetical protein
MPYLTVSDTWSTVHIKTENKNKKKGKSTWILKYLYYRNHVKHMESIKVVVCCPLPRSNNNKSDRIWCICIMERPGGDNHKKDETWNSDGIICRKIKKPIQNICYSSIVWVVVSQNCLCSVSSSSFVTK